MTLQWTELKHYQTISQLNEILPAGEREGIYIWGFENDDKKFWPYYVGRSYDVLLRLCEHLSNLKAGNYRLYSPAELFNDQLDNPLYTPGDMANKIMFISGRPDWDEALQNMIDRFRFTYARVEDFKQYGDAAERAILNCFPRSILVNTRIGKRPDNINIGNLFTIINPCWDAWNPKPLNK